MKHYIKKSLLIFLSLLVFSACNNLSINESTLPSSAAEKVYVPPGEHDEFYAFLSGGFSGQLSVYGLPSGRLFKIIPVFNRA